MYLFTAEEKTYPYVTLYVLTYSPNLEKLDLSSPYGLSVYVYQYFCRVQVDEYRYEYIRGIVHKRKTSSES